MYQIKWKSLFTGKTGQGTICANKKLLQKLCYQCNAYYDPKDERKYWIEKVKESTK